MSQYARAKVRAAAVAFSRRDDQFLHEFYVLVMFFFFFLNLSVFDFFCVQHNLFAIRFFFYYCSILDNNNNKLGKTPSKNVSQKSFPFQLVPVFLSGAPICSTEIIAFYHFVC